MHPHGVLYDKSSEGSPYEDGTTRAEHGDDAVPPGGTWTYIWEVRHHTRQFMDFLKFPLDLRVQSLR